MQANAHLDGVVRMHAGGECRPYIEVAAVAEEQAAALGKPSATR